MKTMTSDSIRLLFREEVPDSLSREWGEEKAEQAQAFHRSLPLYKPTPLVSLEALAGSLGLRGLFVKDESSRFGLKAFKGLGGSYALQRILEGKQPPFPQFVTATDGNHGKGVAWAARLFGTQAHVFMPRGSSEARRQAILEAGAAEAEITEYNYDGTVELADRLAAENGWILIQDTAWDGYEEIPGLIVEGYLTLAKEAAEALDARGVKPTHVILQAGVGAMAGGVLAYLRQHFGPDLKGITVEPREAACLLESWQAGDGMPHTVGGHPRTIMAGLNCGTPCSIVWPLLRDQCFGMAAISDELSVRAMRRYARPLGEDMPICSGESGAATLGFLMEAAEQEKFRKILGLGPDAVVLLINTEGDTDPDKYREIVG